MLRIRLQRFGKKKNPAYRIVVIGRTSKRDGEPVERLGFYNPKTKDLILNKERTQYWVSKGAQATDTVSRIIAKEPLHDLAQGAYKFTAKTRTEKDKRRQEIKAASKKIGKAAKKKKAEAEKAAA
jgi:small subunit ribosomal protein S16